ncbi:MAG: hypothetical protein AAGF47_05115 [Planctomycetota bacterium]
MRRLIATAAAALLLTGCTSYHHITEPTSEREYLTRNLDESARDTTGAAVFTDDITGAEVTLSNSEVLRIGEHEYKELLADLRARREAEAGR